MGASTEAVEVLYALDTSGFPYRIPGEMAPWGCARPARARRHMSQKKAKTYRSLERPQTGDEKKDKLGTAGVKEAFCAVTFVEGFRYQADIVLIARTR